MSCTIFEVLIQELNKTTGKVEPTEKVLTKVNQKQVTNMGNFKYIIDFVVNLDWFE